MPAAVAASTTAATIFGRATATQLGRRRFATIHRIALTARVDTWATITATRVARRAGARRAASVRRSRLTYFRWIAITPAAPIALARYVDLAARRHICDTGDLKVHTSKVATRVGDRSAHRQRVHLLITRNIKCAQRTDSHG